MRIAGRHCRRILAAALLAWLPAFAGAQGLARVEILGVEDEALANVRALVSLARLSASERRALSPARLEYLIRQAPDEAARALAPYGFYSPTVEAEAVEGEAGRVLRLRIDRGEPVRVASRSLRLLGEAEADTALAAPLAAFAPREGEVFDSRRYEASKSALGRLLAERGYFDARETTAEVRVLRAEHRADIELAWDSGPRYRFGPTRFEGNHLRARLAEAAVPYRQGRPFEQSELLALHARLSDLDYYGLIDVRPDPEQAEDGEVPIVVNLNPGKRTVYTAGLSLGTDSGFGVQAGLARRWVNERGHKLDSRVDWAQRRRAALVQYRIPAFAWAQGWYTLGANRREEETRAADTRITELVASRTGIWRDWNLSLATHLTREDFRFAREPRSAQRSSTLVYPALRAARSQGDDPLYPSRGYALAGELRLGSQSLGSDVDFAQVLLEGRLVRSLGERQRLLLRGQLGRTSSGGDFERLPPSLRFFAGGDRSVRGYAYQEIGPQRGGRAVGGRNLAVASVELEHRLTEQWGIAAFVDSGDAFNDRFEARTGAGLGLRWRSPVGPVRLDLGRGLDAPDRSFRLHLSIGPDL
jgi:translocation and assembly module TamA